MKNTAKNTTRTTSNIGIALMLTIGLGIAGCGTQPAQPTDLATSPNTLDGNAPETNLKATNLGTAVKGEWVGKWASVATGRTLYNVPNLSIQNGFQVGTQIKFTLSPDRKVMTRAGTFGPNNTYLTTASLVKVNDAKDYYEGWYTIYNCENGCKGVLGYYEMKRETTSTSINGNNWNMRFDPKPLETGILTGKNQLLKPITGIAAPGGRQEGTNLDYQFESRPEGKVMRRSGTHLINGREYSSTAQMLEIPGTGHYLGWFADSKTSRLGFMVAANQTSKAEGTQWSMLHDLNEPSNVVPSTGGFWNTDTNGIQNGTALKYTENNNNELFRNGAAAHLLRANLKNQNYQGWWTDNGSLNYFNVTKVAAANKMRGVNLAGLEFGPNAVDYNGIPRTQADLNNRAVSRYTTPNPDDVGSYVEEGVNTFRIPFRWERLQFAPSEGPGADGTRTVRSFPINETYFNELNALVQRATSKGASVILDMHNYGHYIRYPQNTAANPLFRGFNLIGASNVSKDDFAAIWSELARRYKSNTLVKFGLMNEPLYQQTGVLFDVYQTAITAIRAQGFQNEILINGNYFGGAWSWKLSNFTIPQPNKYLSDEGQRYTDANKQTVQGTNEILGNLQDSQNKLIFEAHQYFDNDYSGSTPLGTVRPCNAPLDTNSMFNPFTEFLGTSKRGFVGEFGAWDGGTNCDQRLTQALSYFNSNPQYIGWTYWASGTDGNDKMTITPSNSRMNLIQPYLR
jgi:endoglucanase